MLRIIIVLLMIKIHKNDIYYNDDRDNKILNPMHKHKKVEISKIYLYHF